MVELVGDSKGLDAVGGNVGEFDDDLVSSVGIDAGRRDVGTRLRRKDRIVANER